MAIIKNRCVRILSLASWGLEIFFSLKKNWRNPRAYSSWLGSVSPKFQRTCPLIHAQGTRVSVWRVIFVSPCKDIGFLVFFF